MPYSPRYSRYNSSSKRRPAPRYKKKYTRSKTTASGKFNKRGQQLYLFKRFADFGEFTISNSVNTFSAYNFSLNDVPNSTEFTSLYDMYKINAIKIEFLPQQTQSISIGSVNNPNASSRFFSVIDYNDGSAPTSIDELRQYQTCKYTPILQPHKRIIYKPKILDTNGFSISPWMSTASPSANYFGLKVAVEPMDSTSTTSMMYTVEVTYYLSFKQVK